MISKRKLSSYPYMHATDNALGEIDNYLKKRYAGKMPGTRSGAPLKFLINPKNIDSNDWSPSGLHRLKLAEIYKGNFPFSIEYYSKHIPNYQRASNFYKQVLVRSYRQDLQDFIVDRLTNSYSAIGRKMTLNIHSSSTGMPILNVRSTSTGVPGPVLDLLRITVDFDSAYKLGKATDKVRTKEGWSHPSHSGLAGEISKKLAPYLVSTELPLWRKSGSKLLTGHLDILLKIGDTLFVVDYKPDGEANPRTQALSKSFIQSVPRVAVYSKILRLKEYGAKKLACVTFNHKGEAWIYDDSLLSDLEAYMISKGFSKYIIWKGFI